MNLWLSVILVVAISVGVHWNTLSAGLVFDDHLAIEDNDCTNPTKTPLSKVFSTDFWGHELSSTNSNLSYRPITVLTFRWSWWLFGGRHNAAALHATNMALHAIVSALFLVVLCRRIGRPLPALMGALVFAVHPVHVEAVAGVVGRAELLGAMFALLAFWVYADCHRPALGAVIYITLIAAAFLSKESAVTVIGICALHDVFLSGLYSPRTATRVSALVAVLAAVLRCRVSLTGRVDLAASPLIRQAENPYYFLPSPVSKILSLMYLQVKNAQLLVAPYELCCEYGYDCIPSLESFADPRVALILLLFLIVAFLATKLANTRSYALSVCCVWVAVPYFPLSHMVLSIGTMVAERCLYVPSMGVCLFVVLGLEALRKQRRGVVYNSALVLCLVVIGLGSYGTWQRNKAWQTDEALFTSAIAVCPRSAKHHQQMGMLRLNQNRHDEAKTHLKRATKLYPGWSEPHYHLGRFYTYHKEYKKALKHLEKCIACPFVMEKCAPLWNDVFQVVHPTMNGALLTRRAVLLSSLHQHANVMSTYRQAGLSFRQEGNLEGAVRAFQSAVAVYDAGNITKENVAERRLRQKLILEKEGDLESHCNCFYWKGITEFGLKRYTEAVQSQHRLTMECTDPEDLKTRRAGAAELVQVLQPALDDVGGTSEISHVLRETLPRYRIQEMIVDSLVLLVPFLTDKTEITAYTELMIRMAMEAATAVLSVNGRVTTPALAIRILKKVGELCETAPLMSTAHSAAGEYSTAANILRRCVEGCRHAEATHTTCTTYLSTLLKIMGKKDEERKAERLRKSV